MRTPITENFTYEEFEQSEKADELGIDNKISDEKIRFAIRLLVLNVLQPLRDKVGRPIVINSGYRTKELNKAIGGYKYSQHMRGEAADCHCGCTLQVLMFAQTILRHSIPFDQMVLYDTFIHISLKASGTQRHQIIYDQSYKTSTQWTLQKN